jgi:hypothetical protein
MITVTPKENTKEATENAMLMQVIMNHMIPEDRQVEIYREAMWHVLTCPNKDHSHGCIETKWETAV